MLPVAPLLDRLVFRPVADGSVLLLLTISMALHFALAGLGLLFFGAEGVRTEPLTDAALEFGELLVSGQTMMIVAAAFLFSLFLYLFFRFTLPGKALYGRPRSTAPAPAWSASVPARAGTIAYHHRLRSWPASRAS